MIRFREHRGGLAESMATLVELEDRDALVAYVQKLLRPFTDVRPEQVEVKPYSGADPRIGWARTLVVTVEGYGVIGFADGSGQ